MTTNTPTEMDLRIHNHEFTKRLAGELWDKQDAGSKSAALVLGTLWVLGSPTQILRNGFRFIAG